MRHVGVCSLEFSFRCYLGRRGQDVRVRLFVCLSGA